MAEVETLNRTYQTIMTSFIQTGRAPHFTEVGRTLGLPLEEARQTVRELVELGLPGIWQHPNTDYIESFAPFANLPTQYLIEVDGAQRWYGQCGFESLAVSWLFPGQDVRITCPCLDCGEEIRLRMRDGQLLETEPAGIVGHANVPFARWREDIARS